jgi:hypothetical protein
MDGYALQTWIEFAAEVTFEGNIISFWLSFDVF